MGKDSPDLPSTNDYMRMARLQADIGKDLLGQQTAANRPTQITPWGQSLWTDMGGGQWQQDIRLNPTQQAALEAQQGLGLGRSQLAQALLGRVTGEITPGIGWSPLEANPVGGGMEARNAAEEAIYGRATSRLDPYWEEQQTRTENQLMNQGFRPGDAAYDLAMGNLNRARTDAYQTAMNEAIMGGGAEQQRQFGLDMARRQQAISEELQRRGWSLNEVNALLSGQQVGMPGMPGFRGAGVAPTPNLTGAMQMGAQSDLDRFNADQMQQQGLFGGLTDLASLGLMGGLMFG